MAKKKAEEAQENGAAAGGESVLPRLRKYYDEQVRNKLAEQFGYASMMQIPRLEKIVINVGIGEAGKNAKLLESVIEEIGLITGQRPVIRRAKKAISNFGLRENMPVGVSVTLRRERMWEFLDRNFTIGIREQLIFPEIDYDKVQKIHGMDITFVTDAKRDDQGMALLRELGMPFRGETPVIVKA